MSDKDELVRLRRQVRELETARDKAEGRADYYATQVARMRSFTVRQREKLALLTEEVREIHDAAIRTAHHCVTQHDTTPRVSAEEDALANANQTGYLTARDQIAAAVLDLLARKEPRG
jgi:hypothetical protein